MDGARPGDRFAPEDESESGVDSADASSPLDEVGDSEEPA
jgi:hypothetical protein